MRLPRVHFTVQGLTVAVAITAFIGAWFWLPAAPRPWHRAAWPTPGALADRYRKMAKHHQEQEAMWTIGPPEYPKRLKAKVVDLVGPGSAETILVGHLARVWP